MLWSLRTANLGLNRGSNSLDRVFNVKLTKPVAINMKKNWLILAWDGILFHFVIPKMNKFNNFHPRILYSAFYAISSLFVGYSHCISFITALPTPGDPGTRSVRCQTLCTPPQTHINIRARGDLLASSNLLNLQ